MKRFVLGLFLVWFAVPIAALTAQQSDSLFNQQIEDFLQDFHEDPVTIMNMRPQQVLPSGEVLSQGPIIDPESVQGQWLMELREEARHEIMGYNQGEMYVLALPLERDEPKAVIHDHTAERNLLKLSDSGYDIAKPDFYIWADSYWPRTKGVIAARYADSGFPNSSNFRNNYGYYQSKHPSSYIPNAINRLSPAEKYDLLIGDRSWGITNSAWKVGLESLARWGSVPGWEGICHGWSAANHMNFPAPGKSVTVRSVDGHSIQFFESDLKGLSSYLWAEVYVPTNYSGRVCRADRFERDAVGRVMNPECLDTNPGSWHVLATNQVGRLKKSFVADVNFDSAIWNYAVAGYKITYFNPQSLKPVQNPRAAIVPIEQYHLDKFKKYRAPGTKYVVGVVMDMDHPEATQPVVGRHPEEVRMKTERFVYDLELDANHNILGGEWYGNAHPDFTWSFEPSAKPTSGADRRIAGLVENWTPGQALPASWAEAARTSSVNGQPSRLIIEKLLEASRVQPTPEEGASPPAEETSGEASQ